MSRTLITSVNSRIWGTRNHWALSPARLDETIFQDCDVALEIQGSPKHGYHLVMSPHGFFAADNWYSTQADALEAAQELFGVGPDQWTGSD